MKGRSLFGFMVSLAILGIVSSSVMAQYKQVIQSLPNEKQLYAQVRSPIQVAVLFRSLLPKLQRETRVPILLPNELEFFSQLRGRIYIEGRGEVNGYRIDLGTAPNCRGVTACFFGYFGAERGGKPNPNSDKEVRLTKGITGYFVEMPRRVSEIKWVYKGVLYSIQLKTDEATVIHIANSAINADLQNSQTANQSPSPTQQTQTQTGRSPSPTQQNTGERSLLVVANPQSIRGVNVPPADKSPSQLLSGYGFILDKPNAIKLNDGRAIYSIDVYNIGYADGVVEVYDARNNLIEVRGITGIRNPATNLYGFPIEGANRLFRLLTEGYGFTDPRNAIGRSQKTEIRNIAIPPGGRMIFTKNGERAMRYNQATFVIGVLSDTVLPKVFDGDKLSFKSKLLLSLYTEIQKERVGSLVKHGMFLTLRDSQRAFTNQSWIDEQNLSYLMATGSKVLAQELAKSGVEKTVINELVLGIKINFWVTAAETFAQGSNIFLQWLDLDRSQKWEQQDGQPFGIANNK